MKNAAGFVYNSKVPVPHLSRLLLALERSEATGKLKLQSGLEQVTILLLRGWPSQTWTSWPRPPIGERLVESGALSKASLASALGIQKRAPHIRLGDVLMASGSVVGSKLTELLTDQASEPLRKIATWEHCQATFDSMPNVLTPHNGLPIRKHLSEIWNQVYACPTRGCEKAATIPPPSRPTDELGRVCHDLRDARSTEDWAGTLLNYALSFYSRSALFYRTAQGWRGYAVARADNNNESDNQVDRSLKLAHLPGNRHTLFDQIAAKDSSADGTLPINDWNRLLVGAVGGGWPTDFVAIPVGTGSPTRMALYADTDSSAPGRPMKQALFKAAHAASESLESATHRRAASMPGSTLYSNSNTDLASTP